MLHEVYLEPTSVIIYHYHVTLLRELGVIAVICNSVYLMPTFFQNYYHWKKAAISPNSKPKHIYNNIPLILIFSEGLESV